MSSAAPASVVAGEGGMGSALVVDGVVQQLPAGVGLAVIVGLADDVRIVPSGGGTSIAMSWKRRAL
jgi:hypothetical protein